MLELGRIRRARRFLVHGALRHPRRDEQCGPTWAETSKVKVFIALSADVAPGAVRGHPLEGWDHMAIGRGSKRSAR